MKLHKCDEGTNLHMAWCGLTVTTSQMAPNDTKVTCKNCLVAMRRVRRRPSVVVRATHCVICDARVGHCAHTTDKVKQ